MKTPIIKLTTKIGVDTAASILGVHRTTVYKWRYHEEGRKGSRRPGIDHIKSLIKLCKRHGIKAGPLDFIR